ncbi:PBP1A family penicillin-binding protein [Candidatus Microgenomates bacterium]|nr:MAG: PBP1A family penicillin-binding protein [Candidatus Microgenomates bacterium]
MWKDQLKRKRARARHRVAQTDLGVKNTWKFARLAKFAFLGVILLTVLGFVAIPILSLTLPSPDKIVRRDGFSTKILDRNGEVLYDIFVDERRTPVESIDKIPEYLRQATIAVEDKNFYQHQGFDPIGMVRGVSRLFTRGYAQGGSTLTQQLVKNVLLTSERSVFRKIKEFVLALQIENRYSKDEILLLYLNEVPYGGTAYGVEAAAETYFGKSVSDLNLVESAILAGLPQSPSRYSPYSGESDAYIARSEQVLRRMKEDGYISAEQESEARQLLSTVEFQPRGASFKAPHFVQYVQKILEERYGSAAVEQGGLVVTTTLDLGLQEEAQDIVAEEIEKVQGLNIGNGAAVVLDPETGEILAMVGSKDFNAEDYDGQVNVTTSLRQPGSAIKPITYVTALKKGYTASSLIMDVPTVFPGGVGQPDYEPENYDGEYRGPLQMRYALANSINVTAVKMLAQIGVRDMLSTAYDMGLSSLEPSQETLSRVGLSVTLGGGEIKLLELTGAYGAFTNGGYRVEPLAILKIEDQSGKVLEENSPQKGKQVLSAGEAFIISDILSDNQARSLVFGLNSLLNIPGRQVAVKTGTTNDLRDNWAIGGTSQVMVGVWVGNNDNSKMKSVASGVSGATPIWRRITMASLEGKPNVSFQAPEDVVAVPVDALSGYRAHDGFAERAEYFIKGTEPGDDPVHVKLKICKGEGRLATPSDVVAGNFEEKEYIILKENDPTAPAGGENKWQTGINEWINGQPDTRYRPPTEYCTGVNQVPINVEFREPTDRTSDLQNEFHVRFTVDSVYKIEEAWLEVDGVRVRSFTEKPYEYTINLSTGPHKLRAVARDSEGNESDRRIEIGVNTQWDYVVAP